MEVPILKQGEFLIASVQSSLTDADLLSLRTQLLDRVGKHRSRGVLIDVTLLDVLDSYATRMLDGISQMVRLRGAQMVIVGIQPEVAFSMVRMGLQLSKVTTALDLEEGLELLRGSASGPRRLHD